MRSSARPKDRISLDAIVGQIVKRLAEQAERPVRELATELVMADRDLPVEAGDLRGVLPLLERDFGVSLEGDPAAEPHLHYARDLADFIRRRRAQLGRMATEGR